MGFRTEEIIEPREIAIPTCDRCGSDLPERDGIGHERDGFVFRLNRGIVFVRGSDSGDELHFRDDRARPRAVYCLSCAEACLEAFGVDADLRSPRELFAGRKICVFSRRNPEALGEKYGTHAVFRDPDRLRGTQFEVVIVDESATAEDVDLARLVARLGADPIVFFDATGVSMATKR